MTIFLFIIILTVVAIFSLAYLIFDIRKNNKPQMSDEYDEMSPESSIYYEEDK